MYEVLSFFYPPDLFPPPTPQPVPDWLIPFAKVLVYDGDTASAESHLLEALVLHREMNNRRGQAEALTCLALVALENEDPSVDKYVEESLAVYKELRQQTRQSDSALSTTAETLVPDLVDCLFIAGLISTAQQQYERAYTFFATAHRLGQQINHIPDAPLKQKIEAAEMSVRQNLASSEDEGRQATELNLAMEEIFNFTLL